MVLYFAYGSNLSTSKLWGQGITPTEDIVGKLRGYRLVFNKPSSTRIAAANIMPCVGMETWGVVYTITDAEFGHLKMDIEKGYRPLDVTIEANDYRIAAKTFEAINTKDGIFPKIEYLHIILEGAREHRLPDTCVEQLESVITS